MSYISQQTRRSVDEQIDAIHRSIVSVKLDDETVNTESVISYMILRLMNKVYGGDTIDYGQLNDMIGVLECSKMELYRTLGAQFQAQSNFDNGDINIAHNNEIISQVNIDHHGEFLVETCAE